MTGAPTDVLALVAGATERLVATVRTLTDADIAAPTSLPGWTVGHVLTHLSRNADGIRRMVEGAARGEVLDQYVGGADGRAADIEAGAPRPATAQLDDVVRSAARLADAFAAMPAAAWENRIRPTGGETVAREAPAMRLFEVEVHHADLGRVYGPADWPPDVARLGLERVARRLRRHAPVVGAPATWRLVAPDVGVEITVRRGLAGTTIALGRFAVEADADAAVTAPGGELLAWLLGRAEAPPGDVDGDRHLAARLPATYPWQ